MNTSDAALPSRRLLLVAAAALYDPTGRVLICQRPEHKQLGGLWEFPGGKVEPDEPPELALVRELRVITETETSLKIARFGVMHRSDTDEQDSAKHARERD